MLDITRKPSLIVIGNGMAGMRTIETLIERAPGLYDITVFGAEPYGNYNRILLSPVLAGEKKIDDIILNPLGWYEEHGITLRKGETIEMIDRRTCEVVTKDGARAPYDRLLIATGSNPIILPVPGAKLPGVVTFRDIGDVDAMLAAAASAHRNAVVIGGGLLGLEAANGLMKQGMSVTVVHLVDTLMERQLDASAGALLRGALEARGMRFKMPAQTQAILGEDRVTGVRFADGEEIAADLVVMAVGIRPNVDLAKKAKIHCERGIVVSDTMQTYDGRIYAVGECVQHRRQTYGLVAPLFDQAKVCANHLAMRGFARYEGSSVSTKLKVTGIDLFSAGDFAGGPGTEEIVLNDAGAGVYKRLVLRDSRIVGAVLYGDTGDGAWYFQQMREGVDVSTMRDRLLFGEAQQSKGGHAGQNRAAAMSDDAEVCGCNGVCKGAIVKAITDKKLFTVEDVRAHTKASASCGSCTGLVEQILASTLGDYSEAPKVKPICGCTSFSHDDVRRTIVEQELKTIPDVMDFMEWTTSDGCHSCRPALNYYLLAAWPGEYRDDERSRFINERVHANIQRDGTFSVVPRMWGGVTSPSELRAIADVADKFAIPTVKVTGGQRIDLLGVKKEDLPKVWADLNQAGLVSGHAYAKGLRTVKTCVGTDWCRFGTQDSTGLGVRLEKFLWGSWTPAKVKMAVSGCPRNCAEATCKDIGVVCVESGYEIQFAGAAGLHIKGTEFLTKTASEDECLEIIAALIQLYREQGRYLERMYKWCDRVGLETIRKAVVNDIAGRKALFARFAYSQQFAQSDPWAERAKEGAARQEFTPMAELELA